MATLTVSRRHYYPDRLRAYKILIDGEVAGRIRAGQSIEIDVPEGPHVLQAKIDWCSSKPLTVDVAQTGSAVIVRTGMPGWRIVLALFYITVLTRKYLVLEEIRPANNSLNPTALRAAG